MTVAESEGRFEPAGCLRGTSGPTRHASPARNIQYNVVMCARFTLRTAPRWLSQSWLGGDWDSFTPRYNIAPSQEVAAFRYGAAPRGPDLVMLRWGLQAAAVPGSTARSLRINARSETVHQKVSFRESFRLRRCVVLADGYYEWRRSGGGRQPYFVRLRDDRVFGFAGIWESCREPGGAEFEACAILTTDANPLTRRIHARMPVILQRGGIEQWLDPDLDQVDSLHPLMRPLAAAKLTLEAVSKYVNHVVHEGPECIQSVDPLVQRDLF